MLNNPTFLILILLYVSCISSNDDVSLDYTDNKSRNNMSFIYLILGGLMFNSICFGIIVVFTLKYYNKNKNDTTNYARIAMESSVTETESDLTDIA